MISLPIAGLADHEPSHRDPSRLSHAAGRSRREGSNVKLALRLLIETRVSPCNQKVKRHESIRPHPAAVSSDARRELHGSDPEEAAVDRVAPFQPEKDFSGRREK